MPLARAGLLLLHVVPHLLQLRVVGHRNLPTGLPRLGVIHTEMDEASDTLSVGRLHVVAVLPEIPHVMPHPVLQVPTMYDRMVRVMV